MSLPVGVEVSWRSAGCRLESEWSLIVKSLRFANIPPNEDSIGQRNDHCTGSNKVY